AIGREAHYHKEPEVSWDDASRALDVEDRRRFAAGVASLARRDVVSVSGSSGSRTIRFTEPIWFALAGTLGLSPDQRSWRDLLLPGVPVATLNALTGALMASGLRGATGQRPVKGRSNEHHPGPVLDDARSFVRVLMEVGVDPTNVSLEMVRAVIA